MFLVFLYYSSDCCFFYHFIVLYVIYLYRVIRILQLTLVLEYYHYLLLTLAGPGLKLLCVILVYPD